MYVCVVMCVHTSLTTLNTSEAFLFKVSARVLAATGEKDACPVMAESFVQWVIEDEFAAEKPSWHLVGR